MTTFQKITLITGVLAFSALQTGCGLKGDLYLPDAVAKEKIKAAEELEKQKKSQKENEKK